MAIIFKAIANASPKLLILNQDYFSNYCFFWSNLNKIKIMIISLTEMIELLHFNPNLVFDEKRLMNHIKRLSFVTQFKSEFLLPLIACGKVLQ